VVEEWEELYRVLHVSKLDKTWSVTVTIEQTARLDGQVKGGCCWHCCLRLSLPIIRGSSGRSKARQISRLG
jgi:hypothetical protein